MKRYIIFDLDGTLVDSLPGIAEGVNRALRALGLPEHSPGEVRGMIGSGAANLCAKALGYPDAEHTPPDKLEALHSIFRKEYPTCWQGEYTVPYPWIANMLTLLSAEGAQLAVLSNKPHLQTIDVIVSLFGEGCFDCILGQRDGYPVKPDPCGVFEILRQMKLKPEDVLYLGDTATDMKTGKAAGAFTVGALWGFRDRKELENGGADVVISHPLEVLDYLA